MEIITREQYEKIPSTNRGAWKHRKFKTMMQNLYEKHGKNHGYNESVNELYKQFKDGKKRKTAAIWAMKDFIRNTMENIEIGEIKTITDKHGSKGLSMPIVEK